MTDDKKVFEYTEKHYPDQFLKVKINYDEELKIIKEDANKLKQLLSK